jgi:hypothetical protein
MGSWTVHWVEVVDKDGDMTGIVSEAEVAIVQETMEGPMTTDKSEPETGETVEEKGKTCKTSSGARMVVAGTYIKSKDEIRTTELVGDQETTTISEVEVIVEGLSKDGYIA